MMTEYNLADLNAARCTKEDVDFIPITITLPDTMIERVEQIEPRINMDIVYANLVAIGLNHLDELTSDNASRLL